MSTNSADVNAFYAALLSDKSALDLVNQAWGKPEAPLPSPIVTRVASVDGNIVKPGRFPKGSTRAIRRGDKTVTVAVKDCSLPKGGTFSPTEFLAALRVAGMRQAVDTVTGEFQFMRNGEPRMVCDDGCKRDDERSAIAGYLGYDMADLHGTQLDRCTMIARRAIQVEQEKLAGTHRVAEHPHRSYLAHAAKWSMLGFVAGLPKPVEKLLMDLGARERLALEDVIMFSKLRDLVGEPETFALRAEDFAKALNKAYPDGQVCVTAPMVDEAGDPVMEKTGVMLPKVVNGEIVEEPEMRQATALRKQVSINPIKAKILSAQAESPAALEMLLAVLEAHSSARLEAIRADAAQIDSDTPTPAQILSAHEAMLKRGMPAFEDTLSDLVSGESK